MTTLRIPERLFYFVKSSISEIRISVNALYEYLLIPVIDSLSMEIASVSDPARAIRAAGATRLLILLLN
jgi:hypothetical protein